MKISFIICLTAVNAVGIPMGLKKQVMNFAWDLTNVSSRIQNLFLLLGCFYDP